MQSHMENSKDNQNLGFLIKTIIVGDANVGKSSILKRFTQDEFNKNYNATIGLEFESKELSIRENSTDPNMESQKITLQIWDTAGQESFRSIVKSFYRNSAAVLLVYDVTNKKSFERLREWVKEIRDNSHNDVIIVLIGNKRDEVEQEIDVSEREIVELVKEQNISMHFFTSAKSNYLIKESFEYAANEVYLRFIKDKHQFSNGIRSSSRSLSIDNNKARELQQQIDHQESKQPTPQHRYSIKNLKLNNSINTDQNLNQELVDKSDDSSRKKKKCAC